MARQADEKTFPLGDLPFAMLVTVMSRTTPVGVARLTVVSRSFAEAATSDLAWRRFLPADVIEIVKNAHGGPLVYDSLKALYDRLAKQVLLGDGNEAYWIDRKTGGVHRSYSARTLRIAWGDTEQYWKWIHHEGSRFSEAVFLNDVCWLELDGEITTRLPPGTYTLSWVLKFDRALSYGWNWSPVILSLTHGVQHHQSRGQWVLDAPFAERDEDWFRWSEHGVGQFTVDRGDDPSSSGEVNLTFRMEEISTGDWKKGMYVDGVVIRPAPICLSPEVR